MATAQTSRAEASFTPELFDFLSELKANNNREWFTANKRRYDEVLLERALDFIVDFSPRLEKISPHFNADPRPVGGSLFRIYRDTRFSRDKSPYKTHVGIHFRHEAAKDAHAPGFYLHLAPGEVMAAGGIWHPEREAVAKIREAIAADPQGWRRATRSKPFSPTFQLGGDSLKRPPAGFDSDHPMVDDLKRKDFYGYTVLDERDAFAAGFVDEYARLCRAVAPLMRFLCGALEVPY